VKDEGRKICQSTGNFLALNLDAEFLKEDHRTNDCHSDHNLALHHIPSARTHFHERTYSRVNFLEISALINKRELSLGSANNIVKTSQLGRPCGAVAIIKINLSGEFGVYLQNAVMHHHIANLHCLRYRP
jgi:hypothetical protein